jgi:hypothetical protein
MGTNIKECKSQIYLKVISIVRLVDEILQDQEENGRRQQCVINYLIHPVT